MIGSHTRVPAVYCRPTSNEEHPGSYFCEACAIYMHADDREWRRHAISAAHVCQLDSLQTFGVLGHMPDEEGMLEYDPTLTEEQLHHFGCTDCQAILRVQRRVLTAKNWPYGYTGLNYASIKYDGLHTYWAVAAMRLSCALKTEEKKLKMHLEPGELFCLAELLMQKSDLRGLLVYGHMNPSFMCFGDALAVNMLLQALPNQQQLESIELLLESPSGEKLEQTDSEDESEYSKGNTDNHTDRLYRPAWESVNRLLERNMRHNLRYASFMLPYKRGKLKQYADKAWQSVMKGFEAAKLPDKVTAVIMGQHSRLGAQSNLRLLPENVLQDIVSLACPRKGPTLKIGNDHGQSYTMP